MSTKNAVIVCCLAILCSLVALSSAAGQSRGVLLQESVAPTEEASRYAQWVHGLPPPVSTVNVYPSGDTNDVQFFEPHSRSEYIFVTFVSYRNRNWDMFGQRGYYGLVHGFGALPFAANPASDLGPTVRPGTLGQIAFYSNRSGNYDIYLAEWEGRNPVRLIDNPGYDGQPAWSPDGRRLVFVSNRDGNEELYVYSFDSATLSRLTYSVEPDFAPTFSPRGNEIVWVRAINATEAVLYKANLDGSNARALTMPLRYLQNPAFSPNNASIAIDYDANNDGWNDIALVDSSGDNLRVLRYADNLTDWWVGSWANDSELLVTHVKYVIYNQQRYIQELNVQTYLPASNTLNFSGGHLDMAPHAVLVDSSPPETHVQPLPRYTKAEVVTATVSMSDNGPAPATRLELQSRLDDSGDWRTVEIQQLDPSFIIDSFPFTVNLPLGKRVSLRSQAIDDAENVEPWPDGDGDTFTTAYLFDLNGTVIDNRGSVIPDASVHTQPVLDDQKNTDSFGRFHRYAPASVITVTLGHSGFGAVPETVLHVHDNQQDVERVWVLPPDNNIVLNSGFAEGLDNWQSDACTQLDDSGYAYSRQTAAKLQPLPTTQPAIAHSYSAGFASWIDSDVDSSGTIHLIWAYAFGTPHLQYSQKPQGGNWSQPTQIDSNVDGAMWPNIDIGEDDSLHITWLKAKTGENSVFYRYRSPQGVWSPVETVIGETFIWETSDRTAPRILADTNGSAHLLYADQYGSHYAHRSSGGGWSAPILLGSSGYAMALASDGVLHLLYSEILDGGNSVVRYRSRGVDGSWSTPVLVSGNLRGFPRELLLSQNGELHMLSSGLEYMTRSVSGSWSAVLNLNGPKPLSLGAMVLIDDQPHLIAQNESGIYNRRKFEGGRWSPWLRVGPQPGYGLSLTSSPESLSVFSTYYEYDQSSGDERTGIHHYTVPLIPADHVCSLTTVVTIPIDMAKPTLSFIQSALPIQPTDRSFSGVQIDNTVVYSFPLSSLPENEWEHRWLDLSAWAGNTVSVTLFIYNDLRYGATSLLLDEVTIGSWRTALIQVISPNRFEVGQPLVFEIAGENFAPQAEVLIGNVRAASVTWIDEDTLHVEFAHTFPPGIYDLTVINPGGYQSIAHSAVQIGRIIYLPTIQKR